MSYYNMMSMLSIVIAFYTIHSANGHGLLTFPPSKNGGTLSITHSSSTDHFALASFGIIDKAFFDNDHWITPWMRPGAFDYKLARDLVAGHPQTLHPCGCNAGDIENCAGVGVATGFGETIVGGTITPPEWAKGSVQDVAWNAWVNHGGGDVFMLCKKTDFDACRDTYLPTNIGQATRTEKDAYLQCVWNCFESQVLEFDDSPQRLQFQDDVCSYATMQPLEKSGKNDAIFRFTPIPDSLQVTNKGEGACMWDSVLSFSNEKVIDEFTDSFGTAGICDSGLDSHSPKDWHVIDKVRIPSNLEDGEYLLSWRWDAYTADQMWTNCADIKITSSPSTTPSVFEQGDCESSPTKHPSVTNPTVAPTMLTSPPPQHTSDAFTCPVAYTGIRPYDSCTKYFHCNNGETVAEVQSCPPGTLFDITYNYCNWEHEVNCESADSTQQTTPTMNPAPSAYDTQTAPTMNPVQSTSGCYSNNYKTCNHPDFQGHNDSCNTVWLPNGEQHNCIALWSECTGKPNSCCEPAICYGDNNYSQCRPST